MIWGIRCAYTRTVQAHGELSDEADIWQRIEMDPPFTNEETAWVHCIKEDADCDWEYTHRPYKIELS